MNVSCFKNCFHFVLYLTIIFHFVGNNENASATILCCRNIPDVCLLNGYGIIMLLCSQVISKEAVFLN